MLKYAFERQPPGTGEASKWLFSHSGQIFQKPVEYATNHIQYALSVSVSETVYDEFNSTH
ncbi:hypothetical protein CSA37_03515 [Candidatus Fermentibacteria bacterium]|nr:MAG: hypothetical protein CSA37_03515 [Candidatus Fermentibacteria bacterium]